MDDPNKEQESFMGSEITSETLTVAKHYLDKVVDSPLKELSGFLGDKVNYWRYKNRINTVLKAKKFLEEKGIEPRRALPETVIPLIESAGDVEDDTVSDMFAGLLASHLTPETYEIVHPSYAKVISQLAPIDAQILRAFYNTICGQGKDHKQVGLTLQNALENSSFSEEVILLSFENLWRLGICDHGTGLDFINREQLLIFTSYGWAMMNACVPAQEI